MASIITGVAHTAHSAAASLLETAQIKEGDRITVKPVKENDPRQRFNIDLTGKNLILGIPGAFTPTCSSQVPSYVADYDKFKAKGIKDIFVVSINDVYVTKAWKEQLAPQGTGVRFIADDRGEFTGTLGLIFDATEELGGLRAKRYVIIAQDGKAEYVGVEPDVSKTTITSAATLIEKL
ncbi:Redoxin-domain-containing protein [Pisolithus croceorrhizus]|nr:Redoxin-domain-containing protein [Pisolithus croceorrhizus]KAI6115713.1 Redoxin-domain-containing protein [Pisolithus croceorrhizus]KAI6154454.1 Redoxin-domain-containing protein [Pisolithus thermaeus]